MDIISTYQQVGSYRGTAAVCGTTAKTVKRVIVRAEAGGTGSPRVRRVRNFESVAGLVAAKIASSSGRISAKRLLPAARAAGFTGSARNFRRLVAGAKVEWRRGHGNQQELEVIVDVQFPMPAQQRHQLAQDRGQPLTRGRVHHRPALLQRRNDPAVVLRRPGRPRPD